MYLVLLYGLLVAGLLAILFQGLSYFLAYQEQDLKKVSVYECGFQPFEDARQKVDVDFF